MITDALKQAQTEHVVYFLLRAYVETLACSGSRYGIPDNVKRLPIDGKTDVHERSGIMHNVLHTFVLSAATINPVVEEAAEVFGVASEQLSNFE